MREQSLLRRIAKDLWVSAALALALGLQASLPASAQTNEQAYRVGAGDVISVAVYGDEGLSGQFPVSPDGSIAYPVLGHVEVAGLTPVEIAARIDEALAEYIPGLTVTAGIAQHAPVFVVGDVETPGQYEYRPGMIVLELLALGGGERRAQQALERTQLIAARQEYADLGMQIVAREARRARLQAELDSTDFAYMPQEEGAEGAAAQARRRAAEGEKMLFEIRRARLASEDEALAARERSYADEIDKLLDSTDLHQTEMDLLREDVAATRDLAERGLTPRSNLREAERRLSAARRDALELGSFLARARQNQLSLQQQRLALVETRRSEAAAEIQEIDLELSRMRARQRSLLETIAEVTINTPETNGRRERRLVYSVLRQSGGDHQEITADERTVLRPGDILRARLVTVPGDEEEEPVLQGETAGTSFSLELRQLR